MKNILMQIFNYFFPPESYQGSKVTDAKWFKKSTHFATHTVIAIAAFILLWGIISPTQSRFFLKPQFIVFLGIAFWITVITFVAKAMRKKQRDPAFFLIVSIFIAVRGLFTLILFSITSPMIKEAQVNMEAKRQEISQEVREKILTHKASLDDHSVRIEKTIKANQENVEKALDDLDSRMESRFDRFRKDNKENTEAFWAIVEKNREKNKKIDAQFWKSCQKGQDRVTERKREWCRTHSLSQMCKNLPPEEKEPAQPVEAKNDENKTYIDIPLDFKYEIRE